MREVCVGDLASHHAPVRPGQTNTTTALRSTREAYYTRIQSVIERTGGARNWHFRWYSIKYTRDSDTSVK